ncbi:MAG: FAD-dependent oxidoreductase [Solirubrobacteraceae bacterium]
MTSEDPSPRRVVIVGGGIAALEAVLALHDLADAQLRVTVIAPEPAFTLRPLDVARPFARGHAGQLDLEGFMADHGGRFRRTAALSFDTERHAVRCATGPDEPYDVLIVAVGAPARPAFEHVLTFGADPLAFGGLLADLEQGCSRSVAFVVPKGCSWPLPLYELALMTAEEVWSMGMDGLRMHLVTPELAPLDIFGSQASAGVAELLEAAGIALHLGVSAHVSRNGHIDTGDGEGLDVERIVALPALDGPRLEGLPCDAGGFIPVDAHGRVVGVPDVYAAGNATDHLVKQGGLACQQAVVVAAHIAAAAGAGVDSPPYAPVLRGRLLTGHHDRFLRHDGKQRASEVTAEPLWWPPTKISSRYLAPYLEAHGLVELPSRARIGGSDVEVRLDLKTAVAP